MSSERYRDANSAAWSSFTRTPVWAKATGPRRARPPRRMAIEVMAAVLAPLFMVMTILAIAWLAARI
jgi:hypothetical protein